MLGALLGGLAGLLFPPAAAAAGGAAATGIGALLGRAVLPALGAGLGTLATGGGGKDAIRNALLMGAGTAVFPGMASGLRESGFGKSITGGIADILGIGGAPSEVGQGAGPSMSSSGTRPQPRPAGLGALPAASDIPYSIVRPEGTVETPYNMVRPGEPARTTLPSISDINMVRPEGFEAPYNMARPEGFEVPYTLPDYGMARPEGTIDPGMQRFDTLARNFSQQMLEEEDPRRSADLSIDYLLSRGAMGRSIRDGRVPSERLLPRGYAMGGEIAGPGTGTSDSIPAEIYQDGKPVRKAALSDGEFVMTADAVKGAGNGNRNRGVSRMYELMRRFESGEMA